MYKNTTILTQLIQLVDRLGFEKLCRAEETDKRYRHFTARTQLLAMVFAQLTKQNGLRSIEKALESDNDLYHAGVSSKITRTNLAHANSSRPCKVFQQFYFYLLNYYKSMTGKSTFDKETKNLKLIDATTISLNLKQFNWAKYKSTKSGIKIHTRFDYDLCCADYLFMTNAKRHENSTLKDMGLTENDIAAFDRGYFNKKQFLDFCTSGIDFVTRLKSNVIYTIVKRCESSKKNETFEIQSDEIISFPVSQKDKRKVILRKIVSKDVESGKTITLLTNMFETDSLEIADIYKKRWNIELFFKMMKQNLRVKNFYGRSENAVKTQIWIALITHLLFLILKAETREATRTFSSFCSEIPVVLFKHRNLVKWFCFDFEKTSPPIQSDALGNWLFKELAS